MKKVLKSIINTLVNLVIFIFDMVMFTGIITIAMAMLIAMFIVYIPMWTIQDMVEYGDSLVGSFVDNVEIFFKGFKRALNEISEGLES